jgi:hypothetical protein
MVTFEVAAIIFVVGMHYPPDELTAERNEYMLTRDTLAKVAGYAVT